jgi:hypothetical protein
MNTLAQIKNVIASVSDTNIENLLIAKGTLGVLENQYFDAGLETPEWVIDGINAIKREVTARSRAELELRLKKTLAQREALATVSERRSKLDAEIKALNEKLNS